MLLSQRFYAGDEELGKKDDDHRPRQRGKHKFKQKNPRMHAIQRRILKRFTLLGVFMVALYCVFKFKQIANRHSTLTDTYKNEKDADALHKIESNIPHGSVEHFPNSLGLHDPDSHIRLHNLSSTLVATSKTKNGGATNHNVLFAAASLKSATALIFQACEMAKWQRNDVHFAIMGREDMPIDNIKYVNGIGENCKVTFHDARPDSSTSSTDNRMKSSVKFAFEQINKFLKPEATLIDASEREDLWFREWIKSRASDPFRTIVELPENAEEKLGWKSLLDAKSLSAWNRVSVEIIIHAQPFATGSLVRLLESLKKADYFSSKPPHLTIELPHDIEEQTSHYLNSFRWPPSNHPNHGNLLTLHHRIPQHILTPEENSIRMLESFWPADPFSSQVLVLSPQAEVSPSFFHYLKYSILEFKYGSKDLELQDSLLGISLNLPSSYLNDTTPFIPPNVNQREFMPFFWQAPNSDACLFFADKWVELHDFVSRSLNSQRTRLASKTLTKSKKIISKAFPSWLEYILQLARLRGYMTLYPNFRNNVSFVRIHNELYQLPEEYKSDLDTQVDSSSGLNDGLDNYLSLQQKENPLIDDSLFGSLLAHGKLPGLKDFSMVSWDGEEVDISKIKALATDFKNVFREEIGSCTRGVSKTKLMFSADDLFCL